MNVFKIIKDTIIEHNSVRNILTIGIRKLVFNSPVVKVQDIFNYVLPIWSNEIIMATTVTLGDS